MFKKHKIKKLLFLIFLLALALRLFGIWHGMPFIYNEDEPALVRSAVGIRFDPNPGHFDWPHFHFYLTFGVLTFFYLVRGFFQVVGLQSTLVQIIPIFWKDPAIYYLITRIFNAVLGALTVVPVYLTAEILFEKTGEEETAAFPNRPDLSGRVFPAAVGKLARLQLAPLLSALAFALVPFHVKDSHVATIDVPMVFWLSWSVYFAARIFKSSKWKNYIFAGVFAGLAASTKYNGIMVLLAVALAHFFRSLRGRVGEEKGQPRENPSGLSSLTRRVEELAGLGKSLAMLKVVFSFKIILSALTALLVFFLTTPFALLDWETFWSFEYPQGMLWQFQNVGSVAGFAEYFSNFKRLVWTEFLPVDLSWPFYLVILFTIGEFVRLLFHFVVAKFTLPSGRVADFSPRSEAAETTYSQNTRQASSATTKTTKEAGQWLASAGATAKRGLAATGENADNQDVAAPHGAPQSERRSAEITTQPRKNPSGLSALTRRVGELSFLLIFPIFYCLFVVRGGKFDSHYFLPAYPFFALIVGRFVARTAAGVVAKFTSPSNGVADFSPRSEVAGTSPASDEVATFSPGRSALAKHGRSRSEGGRRLTAVPHEGTRHESAATSEVASFSSRSGEGRKTGEARPRKNPSGLSVLTRRVGELAGPTRLQAILLFLIFAFPFYRSFHFGLIYARPDTRTQASQWVDRNIEKESLGAITGTRDIQIIADGVEEDHYKNLSVLEEFDKYDFVIVTKEERDFAMEKMRDKGFELVQEYPNVNPTRRGPHVWIYQPQKTL